MTDDRTFVIRVHEEPDHYWGEVLDLPGCFATGGSLDELREAVEDAIQLYLDEEPGPRAPQPVVERSSHLLVDEMRVRVPV